MENEKFQVKVIHSKFTDGTAENRMEGLMMISTEEVHQAGQLLGAMQGYVPWPVPPEVPEVGLQRGEQRSVRPQEVQYPGEEGWSEQPDDEGLAEESAAPGVPECPKCGGEMWDNRDKKKSGEFSAKSPDFKCKDKDCQAVVWPKKVKA